MDNPKEKGELSEQIIICEFLKLSIPVSKPIGDNQPYDLIIDVNGRLSKVQSRTARFRKNSTNTILFNALSYRSNTTNLYIKDSRDKFDFFAVYFPINGKVYLIPSSQIVTTHGRLSLAEHKNLPLAEKHEIDKVIQNLIKE